MHDSALHTAADRCLAESSHPVGKNAGAEFAAILANNPHNAYDRIRDASPLEILTIMDATTAALERDERPEGLQRQELDRIIWEERSHGRVEPAARAAARTMLADLEHQGVEAVILGCTELSLLIQAVDTPLPLYDTTRLHDEAILMFALDRKPKELK
jgi:aspartate racemase